MVPLSAAAMLKGALSTAVAAFDGLERANAGGSTRLNGVAVRRRERIPARFRVGERPAGVESGDSTMLAFAVRGVRERGERAILVDGEVRGWIARWVFDWVVVMVPVGLRMKCVGFCKVADDEVDVQVRLDDKNDGSMFSESISSSKMGALRLLEEVKDERAGLR